jgi:hypothetical protein
MPLSKKDFTPRALQWQKETQENTSKLTFHLAKRFVMQDHKDPRAFTIVERYENEGSQK